MTTKERFQDMLDEQQNLKNRLTEERELEDKDFDNIKALHHELVEYEHGKPWKWWKQGSDAHRHIEEHHIENPDDELLSEETRENYLQEEVADLWHFLLQEILIEDGIKIGPDELEEIFSDPRPDEIEMDDLVKAFRNVITMYETHKLMDQDRQMNIHFGSAIQILSCITREEGMGIDELYTQYMDKNEENHERQDGESTRGEEYASE